MIVVVVVVFLVRFLTTLASDGDSGLVHPFGRSFWRDEIVAVVVGVVAVDGKDEITFSGCFSVSKVLVLRWYS